MHVVELFYIFQLGPLVILPLINSN